MERSFKTWQGRLPQELRLAGMQTVEEANGFLRERYIEEFNRRFTVPAAERGHAFLQVNGQDLDRIFSVQHERRVGNDNTVRWGDRMWQLERTRFRGTLAGCRVTICEHLDGRVTISYGPHVVGRYTAEGNPLDDVAGRTRKPEGEGRRPVGALTSVALRAPSVSAPKQMGART